MYFNPLISRSTTMQKLVRVDPAEVANIISKLPFFKQFTAAERQLVCDQYSQFLLFSKEEAIITEGNTDRTMYILLLGSVDVTTNFRSQVITSLKPGEFFGEMSFISGHNRTTDVIASSDKVIVLRVDESMMFSLTAGTREKIKDRILLQLVNRLEQMNHLFY